MKKPVHESRNLCGADENNFFLKTSEKDDEAKLATLQGLFNISPWKPLQENAFLIY
jgi:hypothetical protein